MDKGDRLMSLQMAPFVTLNRVSDHSLSPKYGIPR